MTFVYQPVADNARIAAVSNGRIGAYRSLEGLSPLLFNNGALHEPIGRAWGLRRNAPAPHRLAPNPDLDLKLLKRVIDGGDIGSILSLLNISGADLQRTITTQTTGFPVRENLEAIAKILIPLDTPMRNRIPRVMGSGVAAQWRQLVSLGGGYAGATTTTGALTGGATTVIPVVSVAGLVVGDHIVIDTGASQEERIISLVTPGTPSVTVSVPVTSNHNSGVAIVKTRVQPGAAQTGALQAFYAETAGPAMHTSVYANQSFGYKLLGTIGAVTGFAMAGGANFQNQLAVEKRNAIWNLMLNEENALINGNASSVLAPWGDGTTSFAYNGLTNLIATANGTPPQQVQTSVGPLSTGFIDGMLELLWYQGITNPWILTGAQEILSLTHLAEGNGSIVRVNTTAASGDTVLGVKVTGYKHPISGDIVPFIASRFVQPGTMIFGADQLPDGSPALEVDVLPQVQLPALAPNTNVQGYVAQDIAPTQAAPQVYPFIVSLFSVLKMKSYVHFAIATGLTAV